MTKVFNTTISLILALTLTTGATPVACALGQVASGKGPELVGADPCVGPGQESVCGVSEGARGNGQAFLRTKACIQHATLTAPQGSSVEGDYQPAVARGNTGIITGEKLYQSMCDGEFVFMLQKENVEYARSIDEAGLKATDKVLSIGPGMLDAHIVAAAITGASVDVVQPHDYEYMGGSKSPQTPDLERNISRAREKSEEIFGEDVIKGPINCKRYVGYLEEAELPEQYYSHAFIFNVLEQLKGPSARMFYRNLFSSLRDRAIILASSYATRSDRCVDSLTEYGRLFDYDVRMSRSFEGPQTVYEVIVMRKSSALYAMDTDTDAYRAA